MSESPRQFVLTPISSSRRTSTGSDSLSVGVRSVKMAQYLLRDSMVIRKSANEIEYLEKSVWAERLNQGFQRVLAADLAAVLPSDRVYLAWERDQVTVMVVVTVEQFDVDVQGRGTLLADWLALNPGSEKPLASGRACLTETGAAPRGHAEAMVATLSALIGELSRELAQALLQSTFVKPP